MLKWFPLIAGAALLAGVSYDRSIAQMEFVTRIRINLARRLLASTVRPVEAIASDVGFSSRSHFSRVFRDQYGMDPSTFRRRNSLGSGTKQAAS